MLPLPAPQVYVELTQELAQQSPPSHEHVSLLFSPSHLVGRARGEKGGRV